MRHLSDEAMTQQELLTLLIRMRASIELSCRGWDDVSFANPLEGLELTGSAPELRTWKGFLVTPIAAAMLGVLALLWPVCFLMFHYELAKKRWWVWRHVWRLAPPPQQFESLQELWSELGPQTPGLPESARRAVLVAWVGTLYPGVEIGLWFDERLQSIREPYRRSRDDYFAGRTSVCFFSSSHSTFDDAVGALSAHLGPPAVFASGCEDRFSNAATKHRGGRHTSPLDRED